MPCQSTPAPPAGKTLFKPRFPVLAIDYVRHVGDRVALVVAETLHQAKDAAELLDVGYEPLPCVAAITDALKPDAPKVWHDAPGNLCFQMERGDRAAVDSAFARAAHVVKIAQRYPRIGGNTMEPRSSIGHFDRRGGRYTLYTGNGQVHRLKDTLAVNVFHVPNTDVRVIVNDVGGGFGQKGSLNPEDAGVLWASRRLDRPVRWTAERSEGLMSDLHGRDRLDDGEAAFDADGRILAIRVTITVNLGAYLNASAGSAASNAARLCSIYQVPQHHFVINGVLTNTCVIGVYRGTSKPEASFSSKISWTRRRARSASMQRAAPAQSHAGVGDAVQDGGGFTVDCGDFERVLERALELADRNGFTPAALPAHATASCAASASASTSAGGRGSSMSERMEIRVAPNGTIAVQSAPVDRPGPRDDLRRWSTEWLGVPIDDIRLFQGDTDRILFGRGTFSQRSMIAGGSALKIAADEVIKKGKRLAGYMLEAASAGHRVHGRHVPHHRHRSLRQLRRGGAESHTWARTAGRNSASDSTASARIPARTRFPMAA